MLLGVRDESKIETSSREDECPEIKEGTKKRRDGKTLGITVAKPQV